MLQNNTAEARSRIINSAKKLFYEFGFNNTTIRMIAADADVSVAMPNYYFISKAGIGTEIYYNFRASLYDLASKIYPNENDFLFRIFTSVSINTLLTLSNIRFRELYIAIADCEQFNKIMQQSSTNIYNMSDNPSYYKLHAASMPGVHSALLRLANHEKDISHEQIVSYFIYQFFQPLNLSHTTMQNIFTIIYQQICTLNFRFEESFTLKYDTDVMETLIHPRLNS